MGEQTSELNGDVSDTVGEPFDQGKATSGTMDITAHCAVYPDTAIRPFLYEIGDLVAIQFGNEDITIDFSTVNDLWRLRGTIDEAIRLLTGRHAYLKSNPAT